MFRKIWNFLARLFGASIGSGTEKNTRRISRRAVYVLSEAEAKSGFLNSKRKPEQGNRVNIGSMSQQEFENVTFIYLNGSLILSGESVMESKDINGDVARWIPKPSCLVFSAPLELGDVVQIYF